MSVSSSTSSGVGVTAGDDWAEVTIGAEGVEVKSGGLVVSTQAVNITVTAPTKINALLGPMSLYLRAQPIGSPPELN